MRISFCSPSLTEKLFKENIRDFSMIELTNPKLLLYKQMDIVLNPPPIVSYSQLDTTHYKIYVKNAGKPYFLVFNQRYSRNWEANIGDQYMGNGYANVWYINKQGDYEIDVKYRPQIFVIYGVFISLASLIVAIYFIRRKLPDEKV